MSDTPACSVCGDPADGEIVTFSHGALFESQFYCEDCAGDREFMREVRG